jgi:hypothetical protein
MTIASDIIHRRMPEFDAYLREGESLDDIDEYGFTPLIESIITRQVSIAEELIIRQVDVNKPDVTGRSPLHWAVDNNDLEIAQLLLRHGANANAYTPNSLSVLVYPVLRRQDPLKHLLYQHDAKLDFALDFIYGKLLGHRFELKGDVDIVNAENEFVELDYEGFILEFTIAILRDSLRRFTSSYSTRHIRDSFPFLYTIMDGLTIADELLQYQHHPKISDDNLHRINELLQSPMLILPAASRGHALCFIRYHEWWAKIDRGENSLKEGSVNLYRITRPEAFNLNFIQDFLYKKQNRSYFHQLINQQLGLMPIVTLPLESQIAGNCSWANVQAVIPTAHIMQELEQFGEVDPLQALTLYEEWVEWDKERALDECISRFYSANPLRKASIAAMLGAVLFQACDYNKHHHLERAEKILKILVLTDYEYIIKSYLREYCVKRLTHKGNNFLKLLDDCGVNPGIDVNPIAAE